ncbi:MAG: 4-hydroxy-tetrahydrodipicolinate reductase [Bacteroidales bacterium]|nr:4-hydroxy-tetrahydrodipicolinate reductase [Bacteroidales bacterium]
MKVVISGYGKMGKTIESICRERGHEIIAVLDNEKDWKQLKDCSASDTVVIDFSMPAVAVDNLFRSFSLGLNVVTGTTGWYDRLEEVKSVCNENGTALMYSPNFSLGVNVLFYVNKILANVMSKIGSYRGKLNEIHHIHKLDAPSGTALRLVQDILKENKALSRWVESESNNADEFPVLSFREGEVPGIHEIVYESEADVLTLKHEAKNRKGFALGAVLAAEFLNGRQGIYTMEDYLKTLGMEL